jgi:hypothetical protein
MEDHPKALMLNKHEGFDSRQAHRAPEKSIHRSSGRKAYLNFELKD